MPDYKRTLLASLIVTVVLASMLILYHNLADKKAKLINPSSFLCTTQTLTMIHPQKAAIDGTIILDFKTQRITLQYNAKMSDNTIRRLYRDVYFKNLHAVNDSVFTFEVTDIKNFDSDTDEGLFSYFRFLYPGSLNEIKLTRIGAKAFFTP